MARDTVQREPSGPRDLAARYAREQVRAALFGDAFEAIAIGRFVILEQIGAGGMGSVFAAYDPQLDRKVAVKVLTNPEASHEASRRMLREAQALARLSHPNVVAVYEVGVHDEQVFIAMEFVAGTPLDTWCGQDRSMAEIVAAFVGAGRGLAAAHEAGLVHRDFKPGNVLVDRAGRARVLDFGMARQSVDGISSASEPETEPLPASASPDVEDATILGTPLTRTGTVMGTPAYMAPEQFLGKAPSPASDQFSFCVALYAALYGERPFCGDSLIALMDAVCHGSIADPPPDAAVPRALRSVLLQGLTPDPAQRHRDLPALLLALEPFEGRGRARRWGLPLLAGALVAGALGWSLAAGRPSPCTGAPDRVAQIWDDAQRHDIERAFAATQVPWAKDVTRTVLTEVETWTASWAAAYTDACEATQIRGDQSEATLDLRMECLSDRLGQLDAILDVLRSADADLIRHAAAVVNDLPALEPCRDVASLRATPPLPDDPELRERVAATRQEIARAHALAVVRRFGPAIDILEGLQETVERLGVQSLSAEQLYELGWVRLRHVGGEPAQTALEQSYWLARSNGLEVLSVKAATKLAYLVGYIDHAEREGLQWARHAQVDLDRRGRDLELEAQLANVRGAIFLGAQRFDHAKDELARGLALREAYKGPDDPWLAAGLRNLATVHALQSEWDPALELMERAMRLCALGLGSDHPETIETRRQYGQHLRSAGHYARARAELEPALADLERVLGEGHPSVAEAVAELGTLARVQGRYLEAIAHLERALQLETALREADALEIGYVRMELATALHGAGALATAREQFERALAILRAHLGDGHDNIAATSINLGHVVRAQGDLDRAEEMYREALQIREAIFEPDNVALATPLESLAVVAQARGRTRDALALGERALALREREGADHPKLVATLTIVADAELSLGQIGAALAHAERAVRIHEARGGEADTLAEAKAVLARTRSAVGNR